MTITAYGRFFSWEDSIYYPKHDKKSEDEFIRILGHKLKNRLGYRAPTSDPDDEFTRSSGIYLLHDENREIVYVGQAVNLAARLTAHTGDHLRGRWQSYSWFATTPSTKPYDCEPIATDNIDDGGDQSLSGTLSLDLIEAILRTAIEPKLNLQGGRWGSVPIYAQSIEYEWMYLRETFEQNKELTKQLRKMRKRSTS